MEYEQLPEVSVVDSLRISDDQKNLLENLERKKQSRDIYIPTDDSKVRLVLRQLNQPITLFGEGPYERRERLRAFASKHSVALHRLGASLEAQEEAEEEEQQEEFYTRGPDELISAREHILKFSLKSTKYRINLQKLHKERVSSGEYLISLRKKRKKLYEQLEGFDVYGTQMGSERPLSSCSYSPNSNYLATGCFGGSLKIWNVPSCELAIKLKGHNERTCGISWFPGRRQTSSELNLATGSFDGTVNLWNLTSPLPIASLDGHALRVSSTKFHPSGRYLGTASYDYSWRLWDLETSSEILLQEGHSRGVHALDFQWDGALAASGGTDSIGRVWDLRTGRSIMVIEGHTGPITSLSFDPCGYRVATGSTDHSVRIHDLRMLKSNSSLILAHNSVVSSVKYRYRHFEDYPNGEWDDQSVVIPKKVQSESGMDLCDSREGMDKSTEYFPKLASYNGDYLLTSGFDGSLRLWSNGDYRLLSNLHGHQNKIMSSDLSSDGRWLCSASFDRTFKLWTNDQFE